MIDNLKYWKVVFTDTNGQEQTVTLYFSEEKTDEELSTACQEQFTNVSSITSITKKDI